MSSIIKSSQNSQYKEWKKLNNRKYRDLEKLFIIEGVKMIDEAIRWECPVESIAYNEKLFSVNGGEQLYKRILNLNIPIFQLEYNLIKGLSNTKNPQGIVGILKQEEYDIFNIIKQNKSSIIILEEIQDPGNLGTIIRTADAAGFDAIILSKGCVDIYNEKVIRSTMGSVFHLPIIHDININEIIHMFKEKKYQIVGTDLNTKCFYHELNYLKKKVLIIGNEANGITKSTADLCNDLVKIPILGNAESLNAAIAAGILMYKMQGI